MMETWHAVVVHHEGKLYGILRSYSLAEKATQYAERCNRFLKHIGSKYVVSVSKQGGE